MRLDSWEGSVLTKEGNDPRPEGRDERRVEGKDWAMAAKPEGRPEPEGRPGMRLDSWEGRPGMRLESWEGRPGMRLESWEGRLGMRLEQLGRET